MQFYFVMPARADADSQRSARIVGEEGRVIVGSGGHVFPGIDAIHDVGQTVQCKLAILVRRCGARSVDPVMWRALGYCSDNSTRQRVVGRIKHNSFHASSVRIQMNDKMICAPHLKRSLIPLFFLKICTFDVEITSWKFFSGHNKRSRVWKVDWVAAPCADLMSTRSHVVLCDDDVIFI